MSSFATHERLVKHVRSWARRTSRSSSVRLASIDPGGAALQEADGDVSPSPPATETHLRAASQRTAGEISGGRGELFLMSNVDNLGATLTRLSSAHLEAGAALGKVESKASGDKGGRPPP